ncbi:hypothetical protein CRE_05586 [Caenorhabditis remanei]|uniref:Uncharacterized protein n=2 Tax=Caenorhabditis remanei TaxID=31234 RepID=E3M044_CAERE|nr:hypothetical protein CRE_05586 [Caenorhabditis remanei]
MTSLQLLAILCSLSITTVIGGGRPSRRSSDFRTFREHNRCLYKEILLATDIANMQLSDRNDLKKLQKYCVDLQTCYTTINHQSLEATEKSTKLKLACESLEFILEGFEDCAKKTESMREKCKPKTSCDNMLGDKNCAKDGIEKKCSKEEWIGFRDSMINLMTIADPQCDLDRYRKL